MGDKRKNPLESMIERSVQVICNDGRVFVGYLKGVDQTLNTILYDCHERIFDITNGVSIIQLGLYLVRGDTITLIGELDEEIESQLNFPAIKADPFPTISN